MSSTATVTQAKLLHRCPSNLRECIDWTLAVTGFVPNGNGNDSDSQGSNARNQKLHEELSKILNVKEADDNLDSNALVNAINGLQGFLGLSIKSNEELKKEIDNAKKKVTDEVCEDDCKKDFDKECLGKYLGKNKDSLKLNDVTENLKSKLEELNNTGNSSTHNSITTVNELKDADSLNDLFSSYKTFVTATSDLSAIVMQAVNQNSSEGETKSIPQESAQKFHKMAKALELLKACSEHSEKIKNGSGTSILEELFAVVELLARLVKDISGVTLRNNTASQGTSNGGDDSDINKFVEGVQPLMSTLIEKAVEKLKEEAERELAEVQKKLKEVEDKHTKHMRDSSGRRVLGIIDDNSANALIRDHAAMQVKHKTELEEYSRKKAQLEAKKDNAQTQGKQQVDDGFKKYLTALGAICTKEFKDFFTELHKYLSTFYYGAQQCNVLAHIESCLQEDSKKDAEKQSDGKNGVLFYGHAHFSGSGIIKTCDKTSLRQKLRELMAISENIDRFDDDYMNDFKLHHVVNMLGHGNGIRDIERSIKDLKELKEEIDKLYNNYKNNSTQDDKSKQTVWTVSDAELRNAKDIIARLRPVLQFADSLGRFVLPNRFSELLKRLEQLKDEGCQKDTKAVTENGAQEAHTANGEPNGDDVKNRESKCRETLYIVLQGFRTAPDKNLQYFITKLQEFITTLRKEYIFAYPVVTCTAQTNAAAQSQSPPQPLVSAATTTAQNILDQLKNVTPPCPGDFHNDASVCNSCYNIFAYILLGQVPKLYHSFRFMSWILNNGWKVDPNRVQQPPVQNGANPHPVNGKITAYLVSMGFNIGNIQSGNPTPGGTELHTTFKSAVEKAYEGFKQNASTPTTTATSHEPNGLKEIHDKLEQLLKRLIEKEHNKALQSIANGGNDTRRRPRTIREMLHWLSGVPFSVGYSEMQQVSNSLCDLTKAMATIGGKQVMMHTIQPEWISYRLGVSCAECLDVLQAVEDPLGKEPQKRFEAYIKAYDFYYPANASQLFYMFVDVIYNVYVQMKFVCNMTGRPKEEGGWERCEFVRDDAKVLQQYNKQNIQCECLGSFIEHRCAGPLRRLLSSVSTVFTGRSLGFQLPKDYRYNAPVLGSAIYNVIKHVFGYSNNYSVLCRLLLAVSSCPPTSIGDMISFLYWYRNKMFPGGSTSGGQASDAQIANVYKTALHKEIELFPGTFDASKLTGALGALMNAHGVASRTAGGTTHNHNLLSVMYCEDAVVVKTPAQAPAPAPAPALQTQQLADPSASCAPYIQPLSYDIYKIYVPQFSRAYLSWILHFGPRVYTALEELKGKLNKDCEHCTTNNSIVTCNAVLPELYSKGLDFCDPKVLNGQRKDSNGGYVNGGTKRGCDSLITQLGAVLETCSPGDPKSPGAPLHRLIEAIEQFLWSIRMPFSLVQLSLWSFAVLFISYVFVVPLDHFKIKSHLFNRLKYTMHPSLLIADQQRRVSEVAYFSL